MLTVGMDGLTSNVSFLGMDEETQNFTRLFNIDVDPSEQHNLAEAYPEIVDILLNRIQLHSQGMIPACNIINGSCLGTTAHPINDETGAWRPWILEPDEEIDFGGALSQDAQLCQIPG
eukprot:NODE_1101_length_1239_cov_336.320946.p4 GENE.NODE_1101_length_1239_cov_336.320946~~NODE_1101_length_1239_cov_336.320946.p4  ORF type:complete len:118 (-),score=43.24 NODE_1101_length_1239_cov_336.320946:213-566(-)